MFTLTKAKEADTVEYKGYQIELNLAYDTVLKAMDLHEDDDFSEIEKIVILFRMFVKEWEGYSEFDIYDRAEVVKLVFEVLANGKNSSESSEVDYLDFTHDAERIYASFLADYDIDLLDKQGELPWSEFIALFNSLSDESSIMKAISYRVMEVPSASKVGKEERDRILKLKKAYELPRQREKRQQELLEAMYKKRSQYEGGR